METIPYELMFFIVNSVAYKSWRLWIPSNLGVCWHSRYLSEGCAVWMHAILLLLLLFCLKVILSFKCQSDSHNSLQTVSKIFSCVFIPDIECGFDYFKRFELTSAVTAIKKLSLTSDIHTVVVMELKLLYIW